MTVVHCGTRRVVVTGVITVRVTCCVPVSWRGTFTVIVWVATPAAKLTVPDGTPPAKSAGLAELASPPITCQFTLDVPDRSPLRVTVKVNGVDVFDPNTGDIRSNDTKGIAAWFIDTDYDEESFFVRHAYFLGTNDPYKSLKTSLQAEIDEDAWATLYSDTSRPFERPESGRIAVKVINHFGDEVMKVFRV